MGAGELEGQLPDGLQRAVGSALPVTRGPLQFSPLDRGQGELRRDEDRASQDEREGDQEEQDFDHRATSARSPVPERPRVARLVLGGSPMAGVFALSRLMVGMSEEYRHPQP